MKNFVKGFGIIAFTAIIVFSFSTCKKDSLNGTSWKANDEGIEFVIKFNSPNFTLSALGATIEGSYSMSGNTVTISGREDFAGNSFTNTGTLSGDILTITESGDTIVFTKQ